MEDPTFWQLVTTLVGTFFALCAKLASLGFHWIVWLVWASVCLWAINWQKARHVLATGGWAPAVLMMLLIAIVWSRLDLRAGPSFLPLPNCHC